jgi:alcohol dehydrogenase
LNLIGHEVVKNYSEITKKCKYTRPIIVSDAFLIKAGIVKYITDSLDNDSIQYVIFDKVIPNPTVAVVDQIVDMYKTNKCDGIISIGGGSAHDAAKAASLVLSNPKAIRKYQGINVTRNIFKMPLVCVNTTAGTGSEVTNVAVITDELTHFKMTLTDKNMIATASVNDSNMMLGLPPKTTA